MEEFLQSGFFISSKFSKSFFFLTLTVTASSTQFFVTLENFNMQNIIERYDINPNFKKQNDDYRINFDMKF